MMREYRQIMKQVHEIGVPVNHIDRIVLLLHAKRLEEIKEEFRSCGDWPESNQVSASLLIVYNNLKQSEETQPDIW